MTRELRPLTIAGFAGVAAVIIAVHQGGLAWGLAAVFGTLVVAFWLSAVADVRQTATVQLAVTLFGVAWIGLGLGFLIAVRDASGPDDWGRQLLFAVVGAVWASDIFAYFGGRMFGRRKLAPAISPNKTVEGPAGRPAVRHRRGLLRALRPALERPGDRGPGADAGRGDRHRIAGRRPVRVATSSATWT